MPDIYDLVIIGSGPAGLSSAIYALRANLNTIILEKSMMSGGQVLITDEVDNYPGFPEINGYDLGIKFREHAEILGAVFLEEEALHVNVDNQIKIVKTNKQDIKTKTVILAMGAHYRLLQVPGEEKFSGKGVSYCATCDGAFFKDKNVVVVGGGNVAVGDAVFLARLCKKVYLVHRGDELSAAKSMQTKLFSIDNVEILWNSQVVAINGGDSVESLVINTIDKGLNKNINVSGIFIAIGSDPNNISISKELTLDSKRYITAGEDCRTNIEGLYVTGDLRTKQLRQIVTAVADGSNAITSIEKFLNQN